jgi:hypothetical protein
MNSDYDDGRITCPRCGRRDFPEVGMSVCECFWEGSNAPDNSFTEHPKECAADVGVMGFMGCDCDTCVENQKRYLKSVEKLNKFFATESPTHRGFKVNPTSKRSKKSVETPKDIFSINRTASQNKPSKRVTKFVGAYNHERKFEKQRDPSDNVTQIPVEPKFSKEDELFKRLNNVVSDYSGELSLVATIGVLELLKLAIIERTK